MAQFSQMQEQEIFQLLNISCNLYSSMEQVYLTLEQQQLTDTDKVSPLLKELEELKEKAEGTDATIMEQLEGVTPSEQIATAMGERRERIRRLIALNSKLTESTERYKAIIHNERSSLYRNQTALNSYKGIEQRTKTIKSSC